MYTKESKKLVGFLKKNISVELPEQDYQTIIYASYEFANSIKGNKKRKSTK